MIKIKNINIYLFLFFFIFLASFTHASINSDKYDSNHKKWFKLVKYIITPTEKKIFNSLKSEKDKNAFIKLFWKQRDPTPGTETNEYKIEIIKRFEYANKYFGRGTPREGWQTDRGRIYIILGPPQKIEKFDSINGLFPTIVWDYYGLNILGIPKNLTIAFFKRNGFGEYVLYDPASDGPSALLDNIETSFGRYDYKKVYKKIMKLAPQLVGPAFSVVPGRNSIMLPQVNNSIILSRVIKSPEQAVDTNYATNFNKFKGIVDVKENYNFIKSGFIYTVLKDPITGIRFLHFSIKPKKLSFDYSNDYDKYFAALTLNVILKNKKRIIYQYDKKYSLSFNKEDFLKKVKPMGVSVDDMFPIANGDFEITFLLQNSVNKEFTYIEKKISVNNITGKPLVSKPIIGYRISKSNQPIIRPFTLENKIISLDCNNVFSLKDNIYLIIQITDINSVNNPNIIISVKAREGYPEYSKVYKFNKNSLNNRKILIVNLKKELFPAVYNIKIILNSSGNIPIITKETNFTISPLAFVNHPVEIMNGIKYEDKALFYYKIADLYKNMNKYKIAEKFYEKGFIEKPNLYNELINYIELLLSINKIEKANTIVESMKNIKELTYEYNGYKGKILFSMKNYKLAIKYFEKALNYFDRDYMLLNLTGMCYLKLNMEKFAKKYFSKSIFINPNQPIIKKYIDNLKK
jgi:GWxTD domain-containing protein